MHSSQSKSQTTICNSIKSSSTYIAGEPPSELGRDIKPVLNSPTKKKRKPSQTLFLCHLSKIPKEIFVRNVNPTREIMMSIRIAPLNSWKQLMKVDALLDSSANAIFID